MDAGFGTVVVAVVAGVDTAPCVRTVADRGAGVRLRLRRQSVLSHFWACHRSGGLPENEGTKNY